MKLRSMKSGLVKISVNNDDILYHDGRWVSDGKFLFLASKVEFQDKALELLRMKGERFVWWMGELRTGDDAGMPDMDEFVKKQLNRYDPVKHPEMRDTTVLVEQEGITLRFFVTEKNRLVYMNNLYLPLFKLGDEYRFTGDRDPVLVWEGDVVIGMVMPVVKEDDKPEDLLRRLLKW